MEKRSRYISRTAQCTGEILIMMMMDDVRRIDRVPWSFSDWKQFTPTERLPTGAGHGAVGDPTAFYISLHRCYDLVGEHQRCVPVVAR